MGPRLFSRGDGARLGFSAAFCKLQWGRGYSAVETLAQAHAPRNHTRFNGAAAVQPRRRLVAGSSGGSYMLQWGRGCSAAETAALATPVIQGVYDSPCEREGRGDSVSGQSGAGEGQKLQIPSRIPGLRACPAPPFTTGALAAGVTPVVRLSKK